MKVREVVKKLQADGWYEARIKGSHRVFKHPTKSGIVVVPGSFGIGCCNWDTKKYLETSTIRGLKMKEYYVIFEWAGKNYSAYVSDLPGCISTGKTLEETEINIKEAIELYIETLKKDGQSIPEPSIKVKPICISA